MRRAGTVSPFGLSRNSHPTVQKVLTLEKLLPAKYRPLVLRSSTPDRRGCSGNEWEYRAACTTMFRLSVTGKRLRNASINRMMITRLRSPPIKSLDIA
jgi:hypothetical protein